MSTRRRHRDGCEHHRGRGRRSRHSGNSSLILWVGLFLAIVWLVDHYGK